MEAEWNERYATLVRNGPRLVPQVRQAEVRQVRPDLVGRLRRQLGQGSPHGLLPELVQALGAIVEDARRRQVRERRVDLCPELFEGLVMHLLQARVCRDVEGESRESIGGMVEQVSGCQYLPGRVDGRVQQRPWNVCRNVPIRPAADVRGELEVRQVIDYGVVSQFRHAHLEEHVWRVQVAEVLQRDAVGTDLAGQDRPRPAHADRHVGLDRPLDEEPVRDNNLLAARIDDRQIVQTVRRAGQVERGDDLRAVEDLVDRRLVLGQARANQLDDGVFVEACTANGRRDVLAVAADVRVHTGDGQRHQLGQYRHRCIVRRLGVSADQNVVDAGLGRRNGGRLQRGQAPFIAGVVDGAGGNASVAEEDLVGCVLAVCPQGHAQGLVLWHGQLEQSLLTR